MLNMEITDVCSEILTGNSNTLCAKIQSSLMLDRVVLVVRIVIQRVNIIIIIYQAVRRFHISQRPLNTYSIFFLHSSLSSSTSPFSPISPRIPFAQLSLGLPRFLLPGGFHFTACFVSLPSSIL